jgi:hypothetical protein
MKRSIRNASARKLVLCFSLPAYSDAMVSPPFFRDSSGVPAGKSAGY